MPRLQAHEPKRLYVGEHRHYHTPDGTIVPGVTTVLGATKTPETAYALDSWYKREGFEEAERIKDRGIFYGNLTHKRIENFLEGVPEEPILDWEEEALWKSLEEFLPRVSDVHLIEGAVWHPQGYSGTVDCVARLDGELMLLDWKTARKPKQKSYLTDYYLQAAAYVQALEHLYPIRLERAAIVVALRQRKCQIFMLERHEIEDYLRFWSLRMKKWHSLTGTLLFPPEAPKEPPLDSPVESSLEAPPELWGGNSAPLVSRERATSFKGIDIS